MSEAWFFHPALPAVGDTLVLSGDEARHAQSRRLRRGEVVSVFDGAGCVARASVLEPAARGTLALKIEACERHAPPRARHLACALPKGDRQATLLDMATQLGMTRFTPLSCERSVVHAAAHGHARWERLCLEACKQSRRAHVPAIDAPQTPARVAQAARERGEAVWFAHPGAPPPRGEARLGAVTVLVGPEGGFTKAEVAAMAAAGAAPVGLGDGVLRIETAAVALLSITSVNTVRETSQKKPE